MCGRQVEIFSWRGSLKALMAPMQTPMTIPNGPLKYPEGWSDGTIPELCPTFADAIG